MLPVGRRHWHLPSLNLKFSTTSLALLLARLQVTAVTVTSCHHSTTISPYCLALLLLDLPCSTRINQSHFLPSPLCFLFLGTLSVAHANAPPAYSFFIAIRVRRPPIWITTSHYNRPRTRLADWQSSTPELCGPSPSPAHCVFSSHCSSRHNTVGLLKPNIIAGEIKRQRQLGLRLGAFGS